MQHALGETCTVYRVEIPDWHPVSVNKLLSRHQCNRSKLKHADAERIYAFCRLANVPEATGYRCVTVVIFGPSLPDADNGLKSLLDGLVKARMLVDDSLEWCEIAVRGKRAKAKSTVILLEEISEGGTPS